MLIPLLATALAGRFALDDNHPEWRWRTLETRTARVHFPEAEASWTASRVAVEVDDLWDGLCGALKLSCRRRIDIVVVEDTDALEGFTLPSSDWVVFSGHPGEELSRMRGRADWVPDLLAHELAHIAVDRAADPYPRLIAGLGVDLGGVADVEGAQLGGGVTLTHGMPYWFSEGSAEFWSEVVGVNRWTTARARLLRTAVLDDRLLDLERGASSALLHDWRDGERAYQEGYAFLRWFVEQEGMEALRRVNEASRRRVRADWTDVFEAATGRPFATWHDRFRQDLRARARQRVADIRRRGEVAGRELSTWRLAWDDPDLQVRDRWSLEDDRERVERREATGTLLLHAAWSSDGRWFARQRAGWLEVREVDVELQTAFAGRTPDWERTREQRRIARRHAAWFPASYGSSFAFVPGEDLLIQVDEVRADGVVGRARREWNQLYEVDLTPRGKVGEQRIAAGALERRRRRRPLPGTERGFDPAVSPDGTTVAFVRYVDGGTGLYLHDRVSGRTTTLLEPVGGVWLASPSWAPDGTRLVISRHERRNQDLWVVGSGGEATPLLVTPWEEVDPWWAADGSVWFATDRTGVHDIHRWKDGTVHEMTRVVSGAQSPSLTPDGDLVYAHFTSFGWKTFGRRSSELAWTDVTADFRGHTTPPIAPIDLQEGRRYRAHRALLPLSLSPSLRLDRTVDGRWIPRVGAFLRLRDAVENHTLSAWGWVGRDAAGHARYTVHTLWPDLSVDVSVARARLPHEEVARTARGWGLRAELPLRESTRLAMGFGEQRLSGAVTHRTRRLVGRLAFGDDGRLRRLTGTGTTVDLLPSVGWSAGWAPFARFEMEVASVGAAPFGGRVGHRWFGRVVGGVTSTPTSPLDQLPVGGDHPGALRPARIEATAELPGYAPFAARADRVGIVGGGWRFPLARRLGERFGGLVVDGVALELGGDLAIVGDQLLADGVARLRLDTLWLGRRVGTAVTLAGGRRTSTAVGGARFVVSVGSGG